MPAGGPPFLGREFVTDACRALFLSPEVAQAAAAAARRIANNPALRALAWHCHCRLFRCPDGPTYNIREWAPPPEAVGDDAGMLYLLVLLSGVPGMRAMHQARGIPPDIVRDTLGQIQDRLDAYRDEYGAWGMTPRFVGWFMNHLTGRLYRLVRLQFQFGSFGYKLRAFRQRNSGTVVALSEPGVQYRPGGQIQRGNGSDAGAWASDLNITDQEITGNPILPSGRALERNVPLPAAEWRQVLVPGEPILNIHIPGGGPMDFDECGQSLEAVPGFFARYFPDRPFVGICCGSWILNTLIQELLPPTSNLVRFQREVYLFPLGLDDQSIPQAIFGEMPEDLSEAPRDTSFRRAWLDRALAGESVAAGGGGCFLFPEDLNWGAQVYLSQDFPWQ